MTKTNKDKTRMSDNQFKGLAVCRLRNSPARRAAGADEFLPGFYFMDQKHLKRGWNRIDGDDVTTLAQAWAVAVAWRKKQDAGTREQRESLAELVLGKRAVPVPTMGEWEDAVRSVAESSGRSAGKMINSMRSIIAVGQGWRSYGDRLRMDSGAGNVAERVRALPVTVVGERLKREFWRLGQGLPDRPNLDKRNPLRVNIAINSLIQQARGMGSAFYREELPHAGLVLPWPQLEGFFTLRLPVPKLELAEKLPTPEAWELMMKEVERLAASEREEDRELAMVNELMRMTAMRSGDVVAARLSWLEQNERGTWALVIKDRPLENSFPKTATKRRIPLNDDLALRLKARCEAARAAGRVNPWLVLPMVAGPAVLPTLPDDETWEDLDRRRLVRETHNALVKEYCGEVYSGQGNHRIRAYVATRLYATTGSLADVVQYLGHAKEASYIAAYVDACPTAAPPMSDAMLSAFRVR